MNDLTLNTLLKIIDSESQKIMVLIILDTPLRPDFSVMLVLLLSLLDTDGVSLAMPSSCFCTYIAPSARSLLRVKTK